MASNSRDLNLAIVGEDLTKHATDAAGRNFDKLSRSVHGSTGSMDKDVDNWAKRLENAGSSMNKLSGLAMPALIAAAAILSPVAVTLATGLGGLGVAAIGLAKNQQLMAKTLAPLKTEYASFEKALAPVVLDDFNAGIKLAGNLLHDVKPIAQATGGALAGLLGRVDAEFKSGTWQSFFGFMQKQAGPDIQLVGNALIDLMNTLPTLLEELNPVARAFLQISDGAIKAADAYAKFIQTEARKGQQPGNFGKQITDFFKYGFKGAPKASQALDNVHKSSDGAGNSMALAALKAEQLNSSLTKMIDPALTASNNLLSVYNSAADLNQALQTSHGKIGLATQAMRDARGAANTYIGNLENAATSARNAGSQTAGWHDRMLASIDAEKRVVKSSPALVNMLNRIRDAVLSIPTARTTRISVITEKSTVYTPNNPLLHPRGPVPSAADRWIGGADTAGVTTPARDPQFSVTSTLVLDGRVIDRRVQTVVNENNRRNKVGAR